MKKAILVAMMAVAVSGCATKRYGRLQPLTGAERASYSCREIDIELAKVEAFELQIAEGAQFNMASVLGILGDFGIGNSMEKGAAEKSAKQRRVQLNDLRAEKGCGTTTVTAAEQRAISQDVASQASTPASSE